MLRQQVTDDFPDVIFHNPSNPTENTVVFTPHSIETMPPPTDSTTDTDFSINSTLPAHHVVTETDILRELYHAGQQINCDMEVAYE